MRSEYKEKLSLKCPSCGNNKFKVAEKNYKGKLSSAPDNIRLECSKCGFVITKGKLLEQNIDMGKIKSNIKTDFTKEIKKQFKNLK